ncbi:hypothetical protein T492DRAFT_1145616 [Pavlovales sp. CCMP2436]|nr:hypothetical protein T492DRAFT_1145616 [Pavlovales sp. CCMP2436]|mmetsp:Transcript_29533/g.74224  ORF Transcript_29533/g.74224 Transcript_29533/m.74224 type:complete len:133 (-) Transcript_29533:57-455(-)
MFVRRIAQIAAGGIMPLVIFDGGLSPAKLVEQERRTAPVSDAKEEASPRESMHEGAHEAAIRGCAAAGFTFIVSPFEFDHQAAKLMEMGIAVGVLEPGALAAGNSERAARPNTDYGICCFRAKSRLSLILTL